ncbi:Hypothetical protein PENO1_058380 [Penicillium occitanis (nom. inval.)]|nr:Hypothetical protein PENO1_058380 [Penicillium occitanis (nom. inval.)]PCG99228.1 hypothetical protein PENOC_059180 [Penicillium occitanis (nom. inval.)]
MADQFDRLPVEIIFMILSYVPVPTLLAFGATSKWNRRFHTHCMGKLHLAIFHEKVHATVAFLGTGMQHDPKFAKGQRAFESHRVRVVLPPTTRYTSPVVCKLPLRIGSEYSAATKFPVTKRTSRKSCRIAASDDGGFVHSISTERTVQAQNKAFAEIVSRYGHSLDELEFLAYNINEEGAMAVGTSCGSRLRHLALRFEHPFVKDTSLHYRYWTAPAQGSTAWNSLIGIGPVKRGLNIVNLESLILERAGITPWQLRMLVKRNKRLKVLKLRTCAAVQPEFVNWLGGIFDPDGEDNKVPGASLTVLWVENCDGICTTKSISSTMNQEVDTGLEWIRNLKSLESLSLRECCNIDAKIVDEANKLFWRIPEIYLPRSIGPDYELPPPIEVDPLYL